MTIYSFLKKRQKDIHKNSAPNKGLYTSRHRKADTFENNAKADKMIEIVEGALQHLTASKSQRTKQLPQENSKKASCPSGKRSRPA